MPWFESDLYLLDSILNVNNYTNNIINFIITSIDIVMWSHKSLIEIALLIGTWDFTLKSGLRYSTWQLSTSLMPCKKVSQRPCKVSYEAPRIFFAFLCSQIQLVNLQSFVTFLSTSCHRLITDICTLALVFLPMSWCLV